MKIIGLTGGIGSGKTTVANMFAKLGVPIYIADIEAKKLMDSLKTIQEGLTELLGDRAYRNGQLNRKFVAEKIFNDKQLRESVNSIIHPEVAKHFKNWTLKQNVPYVIKEAAILFESGSYAECDYTILVTAPKEIRIQRIKQRDKFSESEILARMESQWTDEKKRELADYIIENTDINTTQKRVEELHKIFKTSAV